jgi:branched-chain amino acid transport system substrate-binding protein
MARDDISRRSALKSGGALIGAGALSGCVGGFGSSGGDDVVKIGNPVSRSGSESLYGIQGNNGAKLAVQEINDNGGLLGREVELLDPDPQSDMSSYKDMTRELILEDEVDAIIGGVTSSSREAIRPLMSDHEQLYIYSSLYEGGVCDEFTFCTGTVPVQQLKPLVEYMVNEYGPQCYTLAADYNFGHISALWTREYLNEFGGESVGEEFVPLDVSGFHSIIDRIEDEGPDWIMAIIVGENQQVFFEQSTDRGLDLPMASTTQIADAYDHKRLSTPVLENMHVAAGFFEELDEVDDSAAQFVEKYYEEYPDMEYCSFQARNEYSSFQLYFKAVEEAEPTDQQEVHSQLESNISVDVPAGELQMFPASHHVSHDIHLVRVEEDHSLTFLETNEDVPPEWLNNNCSLGSESTWDDPITEQKAPETGQSE